MIDSNLKFDDEARDRLISGVDKLARAVMITLGPMGKTVAICRPGEAPRITKDGVSVANSIQLEDPYENIGASLVREAAQRSAEVAGDGTTSSTVLAHAIIKQGQKLIAAGHPPNEVVSGFKLASEAVKIEIEKTKVPVSDGSSLEDVATISANGEVEVGALIAKAIKTVGVDGAVSVQEAKGYETKLVIVDGTYIDKGYESPYFVTNAGNQSCELEDPFILVINDSVSSVHSILPALEKIARTGSSLLIVCNEIGGEAMQALVLNRVKGNLKICAIKAPEFASARTTMMQDFVSMCGGSVVTNSDEKISSDHLDLVLGRAKKIVITKTATIVYGTKPDQTHEERLRSVKEVLADPGASDSDKAFAERRLRRLSNGIAVIQVGGATEGEMRERKDRVDDALHAAKAAMKEGIQPGGGVALARAGHRAKKFLLSNHGKNFISTNSVGAASSAILQAMESPLRQIAVNCGQSPDLVIERALKMPQTAGYNGKTNQFGDMFQLRIVDPHLVVLSSIEHATSVACNLLSVGCVILEDTIEQNFQIHNSL
jgi:chaperonin GroEL